LCRIKAYILTEWATTGRITGPRQSVQPYRTRYKHTLPVFDNLFSLIGLDTNKNYRSSTIFPALSDSIQTTVTGPRQSFQPYRTRYKQTLPVLDNLFSLIGLDTNNRYRSSTIFSVLSDSIQTNITGPRQSFQSYRTRYQTTVTGPRQSFQPYRTRYKQT
jgi:hypothetical protein